MGMILASWAIFFQWYLVYIIFGYKEPTGVWWYHHLELEFCEFFGDYRVKNSTGCLNQKINSTGSTVKRQDIQWISQSLQQFFQG